MRAVVLRVGLASLLATASVDQALAQASQVTLPEIAVTARNPDESRRVRRSSETAPTPAQRRPAAQPRPADAPSGAQPAAIPWGGPPGNAASEKVFSGATVNAYPALRPGEVLETMPGLIVTQHSGEGKANQYFLRGFNLDHGTDLAIWVAGMPANMRTHGHGQGYADISFLIPELIRSMTVRKGPYYEPEIRPGLRAVRQDRNLPQCRHWISQQRRARDGDHGRSQRQDHAGATRAVARAL
jgi:TonB-dependent Receptor Plug Domain